MRSALCCSFTSVPEIPPTWRQDCGPRDFLTRSAWDERLGTFPFEHVNGGPENAYAYFFDCGIIVRGLLCAWRATADPEFRETAIAGGRAMLADFPGHGGIHPILALPDKRPLAWEPRWSASPGCYQLKSALAWLELFEVTGENAFLRGYETALQDALENDRQFLPGDSDQHRVMDRLHAYSYFLEGLLPVLDRTECAAAFREGVDRAAGYLARDCARLRAFRCLRASAAGPAAGRSAGSVAARSVGRSRA